MQLFRTKVWCSQARLEDHWIPQYSPAASTSWPTNPVIQAYGYMTFGMAMLLGLSRLGRTVGLFKSVSATPRLHLHNRSTAT